LFGASIEREEEEESKGVVVHKLFCVAHGLALLQKKKNVARITFVEELPSLFLFCSSSSSFPLFLPLFFSYSLFFFFFSTFYTFLHSLGKELEII
jgi:hypothetical protein